MSSRSLALSLSSIGALAVVTVVAWWWIVFSRQIGSGSLPLANALPCLARNTDICALAEALCTQDHFLGITRYSPVAFWASLALISGGFAAAWKR